MHRHPGQLVHVREPGACAHKHNCAHSVCGSMGGLADRHDDAFVTNKKRELAGIGAMVDAQGNMLGTTYSYSAADSADLQGALNAAACTQQRQAEGNHADAIFGAPARRAPERSGGGRARRGESAERGLEVRHEGRPRSPRRHRDREERHARDRRHEYGERRRGGADRCEDLRRGSDRGHRERSGRGSGSRHDARDDIERAGSSRRARDRDDRPRVEQTRNDDHRQARDRSHARGTSPARGRVGESGAGREGPAAELLARGKDGATRGSSAKHRHRDAPSVSVPRHEDGSTRVSNGAAGGEAAFSDVPEAARQQHAEPNADQIAWRQAMAAVPEGATVVLDVDGTSEAKGGADVAALQDVGLDGAFAAAGGSWRDRMRKKAAG